MKKTKNTTLFILSLLSAVGMLLFTFCTLAWYSDQGIKLGFEIPVSTARGFLMTLSDTLWMAAPFVLLISLFLAKAGNTGRKIALFLAPLPLSLYAIIRTLAYLSGNKSHITLFVTLFFMIFLGAFTCTSAVEESIRPITSKLCFTYMGIETLLVILSFLLKEKYSFFYFSQLLPMGHFSHFRYSFFSVSIFLYYIFFALSLSLLLLMTNTPEEETIPSVENEETEEIKQEEKEEEEDLTTLSLEDLGIER